MTPSKAQLNRSLFRRHLLMMLILFLVVSPAGTAQGMNHYGGDRNTLFQDLITKSIDRYLKEQVEKDLFSGTVVVDYRGEVIFRGAYGLSNREFKVEAKPEHKFMLGSCTKAFTATAIMLCCTRSRALHMNTIIPATLYWSIFSNG